MGFVDMGFVDMGFVDMGFLPGEQPRRFPISLARIPAHRTRPGEAASATTPYHHGGGAVA
jgi:hypothetical protein